MILSPICNVLDGPGVSSSKPGTENVIATEVPDRAGEVEALFRAQQRRLWGLAYRLTGSAEDADDIVQESFVRLVAQPPESPIADLGPWLKRVATNLGIDALRRRRRREYTGPWLPSPVDTSDADDWAMLPSDNPDPELRYGVVESVTFAFLIALEALGPRQRAVLLLRDVLGCSARETADLVGHTDEVNVVRSASVSHGVIFGESASCARCRD